MSESTSLTLLSNILESLESDAQLTQLISFLPTQSSSSLVLHLDILKKNLFNDSENPISKLQAFRVLRFFMQTKLPLIVSYTNKKIIPKISTLAFFQTNCKGFNLWVKILEKKDNLTFRLLILIMQSIENWSEEFVKDYKGRELMFIDAYFYLKGKDLEFPPSFFLQPYQNLGKSNLKRDLARVKKLSNEIVKAIGEGKQANVRILRKILKSYAKNINFEIDYCKKNHESVHEKVLKTIQSIKQVEELCNKWKFTNYVAFEKIKDRRSECKIVKDPLPKLEPVEKNVEFDPMIEIFNEISEKSGEKPFASGKDINNKEEIFILHQKLADSEELCAHFRQDLIEIRLKHEKITEENNILVSKISDLCGFNDDLQRLLNEKNLFLSETLEEKQKFYEKYKFSKEKAKNISREKKDIQNSCEILSQTLKNREKVVKNLRRENLFLYSSNESIKSELEKSRAMESSLNLSQISLRESLNLYKSTLTLTNFDQISRYNFSETEFEDLMLQEENKTNIPNESVTFSQRKHFKDHELYQPLNQEESIDNDIDENVEIVKNIDISNCRDFESQKKSIFFNNLIESCDNFQNYLKACANDQGIFYEDQLLEIGLKINSGNMKFWGKIYAKNKIHKEITFLLRILTFYEEFEFCLKADEEVKILPHETKFFDISGKCKKPFLNSPLIKLKYIHEKITAILRVPITYPLFFNKSQIGQDLEQELKVFEGEPIKKNIFSQIEKLGKLINMHKKFTIQLNSLNNTLELVSFTPYGKIVIELVSKIDKILVYVKSSNRKSAKILLNLIEMHVQGSHLFENFLN